MEGAEPPNAGAETDGAEQPKSRGLAATLAEQLASIAEPLTAQDALRYAT